MESFGIVGGSSGGCTNFVNATLGLRTLIATLIYVGPVRSNEKANEVEF
jgi:hypothetical protein